MLKVFKRKVRATSVLCLQGQLIRGETTQLCEVFLSELDAEGIVLDFAGVRTMDAGGLGVLLELRQHAVSKNMEFKLVNVTRLIRKIFEISRLDSVFEILPSTDLSAASWRSDQGVARELAACC